MEQTELIGISRRCLFEARLSGPDPKRTSYGSFFSFNDPDDNTWIVQEVTTRLPGRI